jgi:hypothetical protein
MGSQGVVELVDQDAADLICFGLQLVNHVRAPLVVSQIETSAVTRSVRPACRLLSINRLGFFENIERCVSYTRQLI